MSLQFLLDSANPNDWEEWIPSGIFKGITTNPSLLKKANQDCNLTNISKLTKEAQRLGCNQMHLQAWGRSTHDLFDCGFELNKLKTNSMNIHVKIPITKSGIAAANRLIANNISITFTACYEPKQVLIAAALGSNYIAPYLNRINSQGKNGLKEISYMQKILDSINSSCNILVASIGNVEDITYLASKKLKVFTINNFLASQLIEVKATNDAALLFEDDARS